VGLEPFAVDGIVPPDTCTLSKEASPRLLESKAVPKEKQQAVDKQGQLMETPV
jgi:hypothetical protein